MVPELGEEAAASEEVSLEAAVEVSTASMQETQMISSSRSISCPFGASLIM